MKIALLGDIATFGRYCIKNNDNLYDYFDSVKEYLSKFDIVIGNLEAPFVQDERPIIGKSATVSSDPINIELIKYIGFTHLNLANNHIGDFGKSGYERTKKIIENSKMEWFGTENKQIRIDFNGEKISLIGFCSYNTNPSPVKAYSKMGLNYLDVDNVYNAMAKNKDDGYFNILSVHSGQEHVHMPSLEDVRFARQLSHKFNYVYYGHHPHAIQGYESVNKSAIFYSLGNFIFDDVYTPRDKKNPLIKLSEANKTGLIAQIEINNGVLSNINSTSIYMGKDRMNIGEEINNQRQISYNAYLSNIEPDKYEEDRLSVISKYINSRRQMRNLSWYLKRLNFNSIGILLKSRINSRLYKKHFASKIHFLKSYK
jgi:gamma-polyglutamate biosynthesis protein CapA